MESGTTDKRQVMSDGRTGDSQPAVVPVRLTDTACVARCGWAKTDLSKVYHDTEWGVPIHDDRRLFEFLILEGAQAGLSWDTILRKRESYRKAFTNFNAGAIARFDQARCAELMFDPGIVRNRLKIEGAVVNAQAFLRVRKEFGSFDAFVWRFVSPSQRQHGWHHLRDVPTQTEESVALSRALRRRGFKFVGATICYAYMQAVGMVNDHVTDCFRHGEIVAMN